MQKNGRADKPHAFLQICREHHLKVTPQRVAIYQELLHSDTHPTADAVYQSAKKNKGEKFAIPPMIRKKKGSNGIICPMTGSDRFVIHLNRCLSGLKRL